MAYETGFFFSTFHKCDDITLNAFFLHSIGLLLPNETNFQQKNPLKNAFVGVKRDLDF